MSNVIRLKVDGWGYHANDPITQTNDDGIATAIEMWYDRSRRHWVIYPVDKNGYQLSEARYGFGKAEAKEIKHDLEIAYNIK